MWIKIGTVIPPSPDRALIDSAYRYQNAISSPGESGWHGWGGYGWWGYTASPLYYAKISLWAGTNYFFDDEDWIGSGYWWGYQSSILVDGATAELLDKEFAGTTPPVVVVADSESEIDCGIAFLQSKTAVRIGGRDDGLRLWAYSFVCRPSDRYRTTIERRHAWTWPEVMLDAYPLSGEPVTSGPSLYDAAAEVTYIYGGYYGYFNAGWYYGNGFDVQFDSGCRFGQSLRRVSTRGKSTYDIAPARFWTVEEATRQANEQWERHGPRIVFGGRTDAADLAGNMPHTLVTKYTVPPSTSVVTLNTATGDTNASGTELIQLGAIESATNLAVQIGAHLDWERGRRRNQQTVFLGLVPWLATPFDNFVQYCLPIDGHQSPATVVHGSAFRYRQTESPDIANPAPTGGTITVRFTRPADPTTGFDTPPAGQLTRDGYGSSPPFVPPAMSGTTADYVYDSLADGSYTVAPGAPWSPTTATVTVANGSTHLMAFTR